MMEDKQQLAAKSLTAVQWNYLGIVGRVLMQIVAQVILARLLGPAFLGTVAAGTLIIGFAALMAEMGMGSALVQRLTITEADIQTAFSLGAGLSLLFGLAIYWGRFQFAALFDDPLLIEVLPVLLLLLIAQVITNISTGLLKRDLDFKTIQLASLGGYFIGFCVIGVTAAFLGAGVWALVAAWVVHYFVMAILLYQRVRFSLRPALRFSDKGIQGFGFRVVLTNFANWFLENADNLFVGKFFGSVALGNYSVAYNLARNPMNHLVTSIQGVLFSSVSTVQDNKEMIRRGYLLVVAMLAFISFPVFWGLAACAQTVIQALYGEKWGLGETLLVPIALAMPFHALMAVAGPVLWGRGYVGEELWTQIFVGFVFALALWVTSNFSVGVLAWAVFIVYLIRAFGLTLLATRNIGTSFSDIIRTVAGPLLMGGIAASTLSLSDWLLEISHFSPTYRLLALTLLGCLIMLILPVMLKKWVLPRTLAEFLISRAEQLPWLLVAWGRASIN